ncbi:uncharacterized protein LOC111943373, partial [Cyanistes caeruleus]|uniref:uncharacterized protein LOC111943373 n=1 Tax=Cyanistes caeruleus TaxID=156563 RepID=UPI000CDB010B
KQLFQCSRCTALAPWELPLSGTLNAEKVSSLGKDWHKFCLKCERCNKTLTPGGHAEVRAAGAGRVGAELAHPGGMGIPRTGLGHISDAVQAQENTLPLQPLLLQLRVLSAQPWASHGVVLAARALPLFRQPGLAAAAVGLGTPQETPAALGRLVRAPPGLRSRVCAEPAVQKPRNGECPCCHGNGSWAQMLCAPCSLCWSAMLLPLPSAWECEGEPCWSSQLPGLSWMLVVSLCDTRRLGLLGICHSAVSPAP